MRQWDVEPMQGAIPIRGGPTRNECLFQSSGMPNSNFLVTTRESDASKAVIPIQVQIVYVVKAAIRNFDCGVKTAAFVEIPEANCFRCLAVSYCWVLIFQPTARDDTIVNTCSRTVSCHLCASFPFKSIPSRAYWIVTLWQVNADWSVIGVLSIGARQCPVVLIMTLCYKKHAY